MTTSTFPGSPRVALVTGGSGGIGTVVVERLAADGFALAVHYAGNRDAAETVAEKARTAGAPAIAVGADVADEVAVREMFDEIERQLGGIDVLVHTAGIMRLSPLAELALDDFDQMVRTNLRGTFVVAKEAVRRIRDGGAVINFSSTVVKLALPAYTAYAATKGGVDAITMILAKELRGRDITVNAVAPGPTATPLFLDGKPQQVIDELSSAPPLERLGEPADIAEAVAFLAGPARWVNGQILYVNGGVA
ncbi:SDR family oxidoreductase [Streptomyces sp. NPDC088923]|uniref:SDR family oxidoreductase n=1 Tax=Streptomyces sp. NPDC088923 TaxID=3365913 RepID=UPI0037FC8DAE